MAEILNPKRSVVLSLDHDCTKELPGAYRYPRSVCKFTRDSDVDQGAVARCSCGELWYAAPFLSYVKWRVAGPWTRFVYRNKGKQVQA